jgi:hypothetical protein
MRYLLEIASRALAGREAEYEAWYESTHVGEVLALPGFTACERFERLGKQGEVLELVALYEVETDDPAALLQSLFAAAPSMNLTDSIDMESVRFEVLRPIGAGRRMAVG